MATPGATIKFLGLDSSLVDLTERKSARGNNKQEYYTAADILNSASSSTDTDLFFVDVMTTTQLNTSTYDNGTAGVGATITADSNGAIGVIDGYTVVPIFVGIHAVPGQHLGGFG